MGKGLSSKKYIISRINPKTGFKEVITFTGNIKNKPAGYKVERKLENGEY